MGTKGSFCPQGEVALAVEGGRGKPLLRLTSTTGSLVSATYSTWEAIFLTVAVVAMATIKASTITMGDFTITTMEASVRVSRVITDANASTASHSVTCMVMSTALASGEIAVGEHGATPQGGTTGPATI